MEENWMKNILRNANEFMIRKAVAAKVAVSNNRGEGYIDTAVKILIAVVLGALLLAGLYALFGEVVMPTLEERINEMFNYAG
jgi:hypothetical protein